MSAILRVILLVTALIRAGAWAQTVPVDITVSEDAVTVCQFNITNPFPEPVTLVDITPACRSCVHVALSPTEIPAQQSLAITLEIDASLRTSDFSTSIQPNFARQGAALATPPIAIRVHVVTWMKMDPGMHAIIRTHCGTPISLRHHLTVTDGQADKVMQCELLSPRDGVSAKVTPTSSVDAWDLEVAASFPNPGVQQIPLTVKYGDKQRHMTWVVLVTDPWFSDAAIAGGVLPSGESCERIIAIEKGASGALVIVGAHCPDPAIRITECRLETSGQNRTVRLSISSAAIGNHATTVSLDCADGDGKRQVTFPFNLLVLAAK